MRASGQAASARSTAVADWAGHHLHTHQMSVVVPVGEVTPTIANPVELRQGAIQQDKAQIVRLRGSVPRKDACERVAAAQAL